LSGPARRKAIILKRKKIFGFIKKNPIPKSNFLIFAKKISGSGSLAHAAWNSEPATRPSLNFSKTESDPTSISIGPSAATCWSGECLLVKVTLACGSTEAKDRL
jgi:hypothetical protein